MVGRFKKSSMPCYHYNVGTCRNSAETCRFRHIIAGHCSRGTSCERPLCPYRHELSSRSNRERHSSFPINDENCRINRRRRSEDYSRSNQYRNTHYDENRRKDLDIRVRAKNFGTKCPTKSRSRNLSSNEPDRFSSSDLREECISEQEQSGLTNVRSSRDEGVDSEEFVTVEEASDSEGGHSGQEENVSFDNAPNDDNSSTPIENEKKLGSTLAKLGNSPSKMIGGKRSSFEITASKDASFDPVSSRAHREKIDTLGANVVQNDFEMISEDSNSSDVNYQMMQSKKENNKTDEKPSGITHTYSLGVPNGISEPSNTSNQNNAIDRNKEDRLIEKANVSNESFVNALPSCSTPTVNCSTINAPKNDIKVFSEGPASVDASQNEKTASIHHKNDKRKKNFPVNKDNLLRKCLYENCGKTYAKRLRTTFKCHVFSHYYEELEIKMFEKFGFEKPTNGEFICKNYQQEDCELKTVQRDYITLLRHYAFTHGYLLSLTSCRPEYLEGVVCSDLNSTKEDSSQTDEMKYKSKEFVSDDETENESSGILYTKSANQFNELSNDSTEHLEIRSEIDKLSDTDSIEVNTEQCDDIKDEQEGHEIAEQTLEDKRRYRYLKKEIDSILMDKMEADFEGKLND